MLEVLPRLHDVSDYVEMVRSWGGPGAMDEKTFRQMKRKVQERWLRMKRQVLPEKALPDRHVSEVTMTLVMERHIRRCGSQSELWARLQLLQECHVPQHADKYWHSRFWYSAVAVFLLDETRGAYSWQESCVRWLTAKAMEIAGQMASGAPVRERRVEEKSDDLRAEEARSIIMCIGGRVCTYNSEYELREYLFRLADPSSRFSVGWIAGALRDGQIRARVIFGAWWGWFSRVDKKDDKPGGFTGWSEALAEVLREQIISHKTRDGLIAFLCELVRLWPEYGAGTPFPEAFRVRLFYTAFRIWQRHHQAVHRGVLEAQGY